MEHAYFLLNTNLGKDEDVISQIKTIYKDALVEVNRVYGIYDLIAKIKMDDISNLNEEKLKMRSVKGIGAPLVLTCLSSYKFSDDSKK